MHPRTTIRQAFVDSLKGKTSADNRVYDSRLYNMESSSLPGIIVFSSSETIVSSTISKPRTQERQLKVSVECYVKASERVSLLIDELSAEVERLIATSTLLPEVCKDCKLEGTDIQLSSNSDQPVAVATLVFAMLYLTKEGKI